MKADTLLGLQWGDEGKGKVVDVLAPSYNIIARFQGGPNAGHTLYINGTKHVLHTIPSGVFQPGILNIIGNGVVLDPIVFLQEINDILPHCPDVYSRLLISNRTHLILPTHRLLDAALENQKGTGKVGSTLRGIGPAYTDKTARYGLRTGDIFEPGFEDKLNSLLERHYSMLRALNDDSKAILDDFMRGIEEIKKFPCISTEYYLADALRDGKKVLAEGAQGTLLDIDFGSYPYVTSSNTIAAGVCTGLGLPPSSVGKVYGLFKAYCTRVGNGPFPTELFDETGKELRDAGNEYGSTTGRPRRCGWLDLPALKFSVQINGVTDLIMTKADVLNFFKVIKVAIAYSVDGNLHSLPPYLVDEKVIPVYKEFPGWESDISDIRNPNELPVQLKDYIRFIEHETGVKIHWVSVGPEREAIIEIY
jgi:adenylosuccinate synthase